MTTDDLAAPGSPPEAVVLADAQALARHLNINRNSVYNLLSRRDLPGCYRIGKVWRFDVEKVKAALEKPAVRQAFEDVST